MTIEIILQLRSIRTAKTHVPRQMEVTQGIRQLSFRRLRLAAVIQVSEGDRCDAWPGKVRPGGAVKTTRDLCVCVGVCGCVCVCFCVCLYMLMIMYVYVPVHLCMFMYDHVC